MKKIESMSIEYRVQKWKIQYGCQAAILTDATENQ